MSQKMRNIDLIPANQYTVTVNPDKSKSFTCKRCNKSFPKKHGVHQHIFQVHVVQGDLQYFQATVPESKPKA